MTISTIILDDRNDTDKLGRMLGESAFIGSIFCLDGDLGAGKTTLSQAIAVGLGVPQDCYVTSPSFAIMHAYTGGRLPMYHMDFYRLHDSAEVTDLGFEEYFYGDGITVIEWASRARDVIPEDHLHIEMNVLDADRRKLTIRAGAPYVTLLEEIIKIF